MNIDTPQQLEKGMKDRYEPQEDGSIIRYRVIEEKIDTAPLIKERKQLLKRLDEITEILGE